MMVPSSAATAYMIHHVVLPPELPQQDDNDVLHEQALLEVVLQALESLKRYVKIEHVDAVLSALATVENLHSSQDSHGNISELQLEGLLAKLTEGQTIGTLPLHVKEQNAGVLVSKCADSLNFEFFELAPTNESAMCSGRLTRTFPGPASKVTLAMAGADFRKSIAGTLAKMTTQTAPGHQPQVRKNGRMVDEGRDTAHPGLVTDFLVQVITAEGQPTDVKRITKNTREDVLWSGCLNPWRRSPLWLLLRVSLQLLFVRKAPDTLHADGLYKAFMVFMLARLLDLAKNYWEELGSEIVHMISAKLSRRLRKFELLKQTQYLHTGWKQHIKCGIINAHGIIRKHWQDLVRNTQANIDTATVSTIQPEKDLDIYLLGLDAFLTQIASRKQETSSFTFQPASEYPVFDGAQLPTSLVGPEEYEYFRLAALENWVKYHLGYWIEHHLYDAHTCQHISTLMADYYGDASVAYARAPIGMSIMYLTLAELWVACDRCACAIYPMLADYDPEVRLTEFQCLVLPHKSHMERLHIVERYVQSRQDEAVRGNPSVYRKFGDPSSFAVKYFERCEKLQALLKEIEADAAAKEKRKVEELKDLQLQYNQYMDRYNSSECELAVVVNDTHGYTEHVHSPDCGRCADKSSAAALTIQIYEWPVSSVSSVAKATVFELAAPESFSDWRDASAYFITAVLGCQEAQARRPAFSYGLHNHSELSHRLSPRYSQRRIVPLSQVKPETVTHRKHQKAVINLTKKDVCLKNALQYAYYDESRDSFNMTMPGCTEEIPMMCMYQMPQRSKSLERFLYHPPSLPNGPPANEVIASLSECPAHLSIDEYKALSALPLGHNIVFTNVLAQLAVPTVDFTKMETQCLILQAVQQVGPPSQHVKQAGHSILTEARFGHAMLEQLELALGRIKESWESWRALATFSLLARRVLSLTLTPEVRLRVFTYLIESRRVCLVWLLRLTQKAAASTDSGQRTELYSSATEISLLCISTYDVEDGDFADVLNHESAISTLLQASIIVQENHASTHSEYPDLFESTLQSCNSLMYRIFPQLRKNILIDSSGLSKAVTANWAAFEPGPNDYWAPLDGLQKLWLRITSGTLPVHFNLLTGELLVNGLPLARLPSEFTRHCMYTPVFHKSALEVVPTDMPGMIFSAKAPYHGYKLHFGMNGQDMLLIAVGDHTKLELLPSRVLEGQLPVPLLADYFHWYNHTNDEIVFRPRKTPWDSATNDWRLIHNKHSRTWRLAKGSNILLNTFSPSARLLSKFFQPLEDKHQILVELDTTTGIVEIHLPRLQLDFYVEAGNNSVYSRQLRGYAIDADQSVGTIVGLFSKLTLKNEYTSERSILIPVPQRWGKTSITYKKLSKPHQQHVTINPDHANKAYTYNIDETLGRISDTSDLQSRLFLSYLHAITSGVLPDPLTQRTGVEASLEILQSAAVRSFDVLTQQNVELLTQIAGLSFEAKFYPAHLRVMQSIVWDEDLPSLSQHTSFRALVSGLLEQAKKMQVFHPKNPVFTLVDQAQFDLASNAYLEERSQIRTSTFCVAGFGAEKFTAAQDLSYSARDRQLSSERGRRAYMAATLMLRGPASLHGKVSDLKGLLLRTDFRDATIQGISPAFDAESLRFAQNLRYDSRWLEESESYTTEKFIKLHRCLSNVSASCNRYDLATWLSSMAYALSAKVDVIQVLAAFYRLPDLAAIQPPAATVYNLSRGDRWNEADIRAVLSVSTISFDSSAEARLPRQPFETTEQHDARIYSLFMNRKNIAIQECLEALQKQWPVARPTMPDSNEINAYLKFPKATNGVLDHFRRWNDNLLFHGYLDRISATLAQQPTLSVPAARFIFNLPSKNDSLGDDVRHFGMQDIFAVTPANIDSPPCEPEVTVAKENVPAEQFTMQNRPEDFCQCLLDSAKSKCERDYVEVLRSSCRALKMHVNNSSAHKVLCEGAQNLLHKYFRQCQEHFSAFDSAFTGLFSDEVGSHIQHLPRISPTFWLSQLHRDRFEALPEPWQDAIIQYGLAITNLHRAQRLVRLSSKTVDLIEELQHTGHTNWDVRQFPETLLLECESGILVRKEQEYIASHMRCPPDGQNIVLQLLMGGGKSTTIVPIVSAYLGNRKKLVRVVVAKPQSKQMLQMLVTKLGGLLGRRVYQMPFARTLRLGPKDACVIQEIYEECIANRGVLLIQPEHIISFKLMAIECMLIDEQDTAKSLLSTQEFFDNVSVDIVDEADDNFSVRFELIYTMGAQENVELAPERWLIIQEILGLFPRFATEVKKLLPEAIDIQDNGDGIFPRIRFVDSNGADEILRRLGMHIVEFGISGLPSRSQSPDIQAAILRYISEINVQIEDIQAIEHSKFWTETTVLPLLLMRGLFAGGVLRFVFTHKRYRVNFGLDHSRTPPTSLAVPFAAKDQASPRSEFSHPDVVIILTLLSTYYNGLSDDDLFSTLTHVLRSDQSAIHYKEFVGTASSSLPAAFRQLSAISMRDEHQCVEEVFPALRHSKKAVDYFLSYLVFPKQLKQFPKKLCASGWDLAAKKAHPTTGFSGTNDTLPLLPLDISHLDLESQSHTNARVLSFLLMDETKVENLPPRTTGTVSDGEHLLTFIEDLKDDVRVLLDCGASILEQNNSQVAQTWLQMRSDNIQAVVYFEDDELSVLDRTSKIESFQTSPYAKMLDACIVYLDESHTRGTNLVLPRHYRAALTLGAQLTKDRLTQASMRMRKLGHGQAITFIVPEEIRTKIYLRTSKPANVPIEVDDVLCWAITETWQDLKRSMPLWAVQGQRFESHKHLLDGANTTEDQAIAFLEDEAQSLETRYKPRTKDDAGFANWDMSNENITKIVSRCHDFEAMDFGSAGLDEEQEQEQEQERELAPEIEQEFQVEWPEPMEPHPQRLHRDLERLVRYGEFVFGSGAWTPAFQALSTTSAGKLIELSEFPTDLLVTFDFMDTVRVPSNFTKEPFTSDSTEASFMSDVTKEPFTSDPYQRPVQYLLSVPSKIPGRIENLIIISPYEANMLLPQLRTQNKVTLHLFSARTNASFASLDHLTLYTIGRPFYPASVPRSLTLQLNLFAGSLYLRSLSEYNELCDHLGLLRGTATHGQQVCADGFLDPPSGIWGLKTSPVPFLRALLMKIRSEGEGVEKTHLGKLLNGIRLDEADFVGLEE